MSPSPDATPLVRVLTRWWVHVPGGFHGRRRPCRGRRKPPAGSERWGREAGAGASVALKCRWLLSAWDAGGPLLFKVTLISDFYQVTYERAQIQFECDICDRSSCVCKTTVCCRDRAGGVPLRLRALHSGPPRPPAASWCWAREVRPAPGPVSLWTSKGTDRRPPASPFGCGDERGFGHREWAKSC